MTFKDRLTLVRLERQNGKGGYIETATRQIWAKVSDLGVTTKLSASAAGRSAELQAYCHRKEAEGFTHADYKGQRYRIDSTGAADNGRHVRLILTRGQ